MDGASVVQSFGWLAKSEGLLYNVDTNIKKGTAMKYHKFFAWATICCFFMTMVTGYKKK